MRCTSLALTLLAASALGQEMAEKVSASCDGARLGPALEVFSKAANVPMRVGSGMAGEIVAFRFDDAPLGLAMKRLATAVDGQWIMTEGVWTLAPDASAREAQRSKARQARYDTLRKQLTAILAPPKKQDPKGGSAEAEPQDPDDLVIPRLVSRLDLRAIADLPSSGRLVFATSPNRLQRPMTLDTASVKLLVDDHNQRVELERQSKQNQEVLTDEETKWRAWMKKMGLDRERDRKPIQDVPAKALLICERPSEGFGGGAISCTLKLYDGQGNTVLLRSRSFDTDETRIGLTDSVVATSPENVKPAQEHQFDPKSPKIPWTDTAKAFEAFGKQADQMFLGGDVFKLPEAMKEAIQNPDRIEPLSVILGHGLVECAKASQVQMVASLPDGGLDIGFGGRSELESTVDRFLYGVEMGQEIDIARRDGWWTVKPQDPLDARTKRADRVALSEITRKGGSGASIGLEELARYAAKQPEPFLSAVSSAYLMLSTPGIMGMMMGGRQWDFLRLYGLLGPSERAALESGRQMPLSSLTTDQVAVVNKMVYGATPEIQVGPPPKDDDMGALGLFGVAWQSMEGSDDADYREEPTELCPNGLPSAGFLSLGIHSEYLLKPAKGGGIFEMFGTGGIQEFAMFQLMRENPALSQGTPLPEVKDVFVGNRRILRFAIQLAQDAAVRGSLNDDKVDTNGKPISVANLPGEVKAALEKAVAELKKLELPFLDPSMIGRGRPPIPPSPAP